MTQNELVFKSCDSYPKILVCAQELGFPDVESALWDLIRKPPNIVEIYRFDREKLINYLDFGNPTYTGSDTIEFFNKNKKMAFGLVWEDDHFEIRTYGVYF